MKTFREFSDECYLSLLSIDEGWQDSAVRALNSNPKVAEYLLKGAEGAGKVYRRLRYGKRIKPTNIRDLGNSGKTPTGKPQSQVIDAELVDDLGKTPPGKTPPGKPQLPPARSGSGRGGALVRQSGIKTNLNVPTKNALKGLRTGAVLGGAIDTALEKEKGSGWARSLAKGTASALGGLAGGALGSAAGPVGTFAGGAAGSMAAGKAFDVAAGANAKERAAMRQQKRQSQEGGALKGIGGKTTFDTKKGTMTTGSGKQQKTVQLAKTSVVKDPKTGKAEVGHLAYKDGKAVYKRADTSNAALAKTSSNPWERIGRTLFADKYKKHDEQQRAAKLKQAAQSDIKRQQALGVEGSKNLVGPKIVGPKIVGPKKPAPTTPTKKPPNLPNIK